MARRILKDKRVRLAGMVKTFDSEGFPSDGYMPLHEGDGMVWAYYRTAGGSVYWSSDALQSKCDAIFIIGYDPIVAHTPAFGSLFLEYGGALWTVTRVDGFEGYRRDLTLYATRKSSSGGMSPLVAYNAATIEKQFGKW